MQDEQFMRSWNDNHSRFSAEFDRGVAHIVNRFSRRKMRRGSIGNPYGIPDEIDSPTLSPGARASLNGLGASLLTITLWAVVLMLATPMPGLAATPDAPVASVECLAHPYLA